MKKLESKQETFGNNRGVVLRKNEKSLFQNGFAEDEVYSKEKDNRNLIFSLKQEPTNIFKTEKKSKDNSISTTSYTMVTVTPNSNPTARISVSSFDKSKEDYDNQFSEKVNRNRNEKI